MRSKLIERLPRQRLLAAAVAALVLAGCASTTINENFTSVQQLSQERLGGEVKWLTTEDARLQAQTDVDALLAKPLSGDDAVRIALAYSPALQAMLYESAANSAAATQSARLPNPVFAFERLVRDNAGARELELTRTLSFSVLDLLLLPARLRLADYQQQASRLTLASNVVQAATDARQAWVSAVAAQQSVLYFQQVKATADAGAELARRMQAVGNYSKLQRAREQAFSADAVAQLARAQQAARSTREALIRILGLNEQQSSALKLPDRLPDLPAAPKDEASIAKTAMAQRLDVRMAQANLEFVAREQGLTRVTSIVNGLEVGVTRKNETGLSRQKGYDLSVPLPIFDFGDATRARAQATYMAAFHRAAQVAVDANSQVRENYGAYRTAYDIARHYRDEIVPLRKTIAEENILRYNGMLIGVFELLADSREQIASVVQAIDAQRDFWLADAGLQATLIGRPMSSMSMSQDGDSSSASGAKAAGH
ncbi:TolC family protein [Albitalea terrae]|uniref:TolC family protein n=2 Tax=Piscinibacter terrae TaxID=2496871 RepID=A0A3N7HKB9_9BURK|nr:TolC family protein [Albitalea terrae]